MNSLYVLGQILKADFLERVRRYSFLVVLGLGVAAGYLAVPSSEAGYTVLVMDGYRGIYNSAWVGVMVALVTATFLTLPGFYLVKDCLSRDIESGVGQIIAASPLGKVQYMLGKFLSSFCVLMAMVGVIFSTTILMQLLRGESSHINLLQLLAPFVFIVLPAMALVAAFALLFEGIPFLRGGFGNLVWFFVWLAGLTVGMAGGGNDPLGVNGVVRELTGFAAQYLGRDSVGITIASFVQHQESGTFIWEGMAWGNFALGRLIWLLAALGLVGASALVFNRFDAKPRTRGAKKGGEKSELLSWDELGGSLLTAPGLRFSFAGMVRAELLLLFSGARWWWFGTALILQAVALGQSPGILKLSWLWPVLLWSQLGSREHKEGAAPLIFSSPGVLFRQLPAQWTAGFILAAASAGVVLVKAALAGDMGVLTSTLVGAAFIPAMALGLGVLTRGSKPFEVIFVCLWYFGPVNGIPALDFTGLSGWAGHAPAYLAVTSLLLAAAFSRRHYDLSKGL